MKLPLYLKTYFHSKISSLSGKETPGFETTLRNQNKRQFDRTLWFSWIEWYWMGRWFRSWCIRNVSHLLVSIPLYYERDKTVVSFQVRMEEKLQIQKDCVSTSNIGEHFGTTLEICFGVKPWFIRENPMRRPFGIKSNQSCKWMIKRRLAAYIACSLYVGPMTFLYYSIEIFCDKMNATYWDKYQRPDAPLHEKTNRI